MIFLLKYKICVDAGHGGSDPGAVNQNLNLKEKDLTLQIALELLKKFKGNELFDLIPTRTNDRFISLRDRCSIANINTCDLFLSIHLNSSINKKANGTETLIYGQKNKLAADIFQEGLVKSLNSNNRGVKTNPNLYVLKYTKMPAVLLELGFISNDEEAKKFLDTGYKNKIIGAIIFALYKIFCTEEEFNIMRFNTLEEIPEYAKPTIQKYIDRGYLTGKDDNKTLDLSDDMLRILVIMDRVMQKK